MFSVIPTFSIEQLINDFENSNDALKIQAANQFAYELIDLYNWEKKIPANPPQLNDLQKNVFLCLINYMVSQECALSQQIAELEKLLNVTEIIPIDYSNDLTYQRFRSDVYQDYFNTKRYKIFNHSNDAIDHNALFNYSTNTFSPGWFAHECTRVLGNPPNVLNYLKFCQFWRLERIIVSLSWYFTQISGCTYDVLEKYLPITNGHNQWLQLLNFLPKKELQYRPNLGIFWFHIALIHQGTNINSAELFFQWSFLGAKISALDPVSQRKALQLAIRMDHKPLFISLISNGILPTTEELNNTQGNIKDFLNYQPGKKWIHIGEYFTDSRFNLESLKLLIHDEANTSDEESSDEEDDIFQLTNESLIGQNNLRLLARGVNYSPSYFTPQKRREAKQPDFHKQTVYSRSTTELKEKIEKAGGLDSSEQADALVKSYFKLLKLTPDKPELDGQFKRKKRMLQGDNEAVFDSLYYHFIQAYVNSYDELFNQGGITRNFNAQNNSNPVISITPDIEVACRYASGERINHSMKFIPKIRRSTGEVKHSRLGYIEIYLIDDVYGSEYMTDVDQLKRNGKIGLRHNYSFNEEILVESSIPSKYVLGYQCFSLPRMNTGWSALVQERYGLSKQEYDNFKDRLSQVKSDQAVCEAILFELIKKVTVWQANQLKQQTRALLQSKTTSTHSIVELSQIESGVSQLSVNDNPEQSSFAVLPFPQNIQPAFVLAPAASTQVSFMPTPQVERFSQPAISTTISTIQNGNNSIIPSLIQNSIFHPSQPQVLPPKSQIPKPQEESSFNLLKPQ